MLVTAQTREARAGQTGLSEKGRKIVIWRWLKQKQKSSKQRLPEVTTVVLLSIRSHLLLYVEDVAA